MTTTKEEFKNRIALGLAAFAALAGGLWLMLWFWPGGLPYDTTSGVWTALADDVAHGDLYRPVQSSLGYGGTRYMPLFFSLHGGLMALGMSPVAAGLALTLASIVLLAAVAYRLMRLFGANATLARICVCLPFASIAFQLLTISIKGDLLAVAFSVGGLGCAVVWHERNSRHGGWLTAVFFAVALLTKFTAVFALTAVLIGCWRAHNTRRGLALTAGVAGLVLTGFALTHGLSAGRIVESFAACATGGGNAGHAWKFPFWFVSVAVQDPFFCALFVAGAGLAMRRYQRAGWDLLVIYFTVTLLGTILLFASPGIDSNHLIELLIASVVMISLELTQGGLGRGVMWSAGLFAGVVLATWMPGTPSVRHFFQTRGQPTSDGVREIGRRLPAKGTTRLLAENPLVPITLGLRPEVMDCFSLRLSATQSPQVRTRFLNDLEARNYTAIVLVDWSGAPLDALPAEIDRHSSLGVRQFYGDVHFPPGFLEALWRNYRLSFVVPPFVVFEPKNGQEVRP
jgi:hypothetical protein